MSARPRGLGRGLDTLLPKTDRGIQEIPVEKLRKSELQPRKSFDPTAHAELTASVREKGVLQPLLARPIGEDYELVAGERRLRAAVEAGLMTVPVIVKDLDDRATLEIAVVENLQREDLNPLDEALAFKQLLEYGLGQEEVAKAVGKSRSAVANSLRLLGLSKEAKEALGAGLITAGHARALLSQAEEHRGWALRRILEKGLSVREAESLKPPRPRNRPRKGSGRGHAALEEDLSRFLGTRVVIQGGSRGRLEIHFHNGDELQRLLELIGFQS